MTIGNKPNALAATSGGGLLSAISNSSDFLGNPRLQSEPTATDLVQLERLKAMRLQRSQRETAYLKNLVGPGAATYKRRLRLARMLPTVGLTLGGSLLGALATRMATGSETDKGAATGMGAILGALAGLGAGGIANGFGRMSGEFSDMSDAELADNIRNLGLTDYLVPGRGEYLQAVLDKSFEENEGSEWRPTQVIV